LAQPITSPSRSTQNLHAEGFQVTLLERDIFPRYHIGETLLSSCRAFLTFIDAEDKVENFGFAVKVDTLCQK
jgi:hypothetical protein